MFGGFKRRVLRSPGHQAVWRWAPVCLPALLPACLRQPARVGAPARAWEITKNPNAATNLLATNQAKIADIAIRIYDGAQNADLTTLLNKEAAAHMFNLEINSIQEVLAYNENTAHIARDYLASITSDPATFPTEAQVEAVVQAMVDAGPFDDQDFIAVGNKVAQLYVINNGALIDLLSAHDSDLVEATDVVIFNEQDVPATVEGFYIFWNDAGDDATAVTTIDASDFDNGFLGIVLDGDRTHGVTITLGDFNGSVNGTDDAALGTGDSFLNIVKSAPVSDRIVFTAFNDDSAIVVGSFFAGSIPNHDVLDLTAFGLTAADVTIADLGMDAGIRFQNANGDTMEIILANVDPGAFGTTPTDLLNFNIIL